jgi:hypothetical protein
MGLPGILARAIGRDIEAVYSGSNRGVLADVDLLQRITEASRGCVREFVRDRTGGWGGGPVGDRAAGRVAGAGPPAFGPLLGLRPLTCRAAAPASSRAPCATLCPSPHPKPTHPLNRAPQAWTGASAPTSSPP